MKTKKLLFIYLSMLIIVVLSGFAFACTNNKKPPEKDPTTLSIDSETEATITVGQVYTLIYTCEGTVTVTVTGDSASSGTYTPTAGVSMGKFSATQADVYTLVVVGEAEGKSATTREVTITVVSGADKADLQAALDKANGYTIASDYTDATWTSLTTAKAEAKKIYDKADATAQEIINAIGLVDNAVKGLKPAAIEKATVAEDKITVKGTEYIAEEYVNFEEIAERVTALNEDVEIKLNSVYAEELAEILGELEQNLTLTVKGAPEGKIFLTDIALASQYTITAEVEEGVSVTWKVNGETATAESDGTLKFKPTEFGVQTIEITITDGVDKMRVKTLTPEFVEAYYSANESGVKVEDGVIKVTKSFEWNYNEGKKATIEDIVLSGDFTVYFDLKFTEKPGDSNNANVMALFLLNANTLANLQNWIAVRGQDNKLEIAYDGGGRKPLVDMPAGTTDVGNTMHFMFSRKIEGTSVYYTAALLDDNGVQAVYHNGNGEVATYTGDVVFGINAEHSSFEVSNFRVDANATIVNKSSLHNAIIAAENLVETDYNSNSYAAVTEALTPARSVYRASGKTQTEIDGAAADLKTAMGNLVNISVATVKATVQTEGEGESAITTITYDDVDYASDDYKNFADVLEQVNALNESVTEETLISEYDAQIKAILGTLVEALSVNVSGAPQGTLIVNNLVTYTLTATTEGIDDTDVDWYINGVKQGTTGNTFTFIPTEFDTEYTIKAEVVKDDKEASVTYVSRFLKATYAVNGNFSGSITVSDNKITAPSGLGWDAEMGKKVVFEDFVLHGEFSVTMDIRVPDGTDGGDDCVGLFLLDWNGNVGDASYVVYKVGSNMTYGPAVKGGGDGAYRIGYPEGVSNKDLHIKVTREQRGNAWYLIAAVLDAEGNQLGANELPDCPDYNVMFGLQVEGAACVISNIKLVNGTLVDRKAITAAKESCDEIDKDINPKEEWLLTNFSNDDLQVTAYIAARQAIYDAYYTPNTSPEEIATVIADFNTAHTALLAAQKQVVKAEVDDTNNTITYNEVEYNSLYYTNIEEVIALVKTVNGGTYKYVTEYEEALYAELNKLVLALEVTITAPVANNSVIVSWDEEDTYTFTVAGAIEGNDEAIEGGDEATYTYSWKLDGKLVGDTATYNLAPEQGTHTLEAFVTYGAGTDNEVTVSKTLTVTFEKAVIATHEGVKDNKDGSFTAGTGIKWPDWEGRKVVFNDLVFNGSFSVQMDVLVNKMGDDANVVTFHLLNADTLSRNNTRDNAVVAYGCICLQENPVRLETGNRGGFGKEQSNSYGDWTTIQEKLTNDNNSKFGAEKSFTVKLDVYKAENGKVSLDFSVKLEDEWITFARQNDWTDDTFDSGFIVGVNIENVGVTLSNFKFELLEAGQRGSGNVEYLAGSAKSKADLYERYMSYKNLPDFDPSEYVNGGKFINAYYAAYEALCDNSAKADYVTALANLIEASEEIGAKKLDVTVDELDRGYNRYSGYDKFTAVLPEGATSIAWTYDFLAANAGNGTEATQQTVEGAELALENGLYTNVKLSFRLGETDYEYSYQDFTVVGYDFYRVDTNKITFNENGGIDMTGIAWDNPLKQLAFNDLKPHDFEFSVDVTYNGGDVIVFRLGENDIKMVVRFTRNGGQIGYDEIDDYVDTGAYKVGSVYTFKISAIRNDEGEYVITFSAYDADGTLLASNVRNNNYRGEHFDDRSTWTDFNITDENVDCTLSNIKFMYN